MMADCASLWADAWLLTSDQSHQTHFYMTHFHSGLLDTLKMWLQLMKSHLDPRIEAAVGTTQKNVCVQNTCDNPMGAGGI